MQGTDDLSGGAEVRVECTECDFEATLARSGEGEGWAADSVADHARESGHRLRSIPADD